MRMDAELLRELQDRGRFFYQVFPGAAVTDESNREPPEQEHAPPKSPGAVPDRKPQQP